MSAFHPSRDMDGLSVLLIGNYAIDQQESMLRFARLLEEQLPRRGIEVKCLRSEPVFGRIKPGGRGLGKWLGYLDKFALFPEQLRRVLRRERSTVLVHICDHSNAIYTRYLRDVPHLVTCHDLLAVRSALGEFPAHQTRSTGRAYQRWILRGLNRAQRVACVSEATRRDLLRLTSLRSNQTSVVHNGLNYPYQPLPGAEIERCFATMAGRCAAHTPPVRIKRRFILHVGGNQWYKNRLGVLQVYVRLRQIVGNPPDLLMVGKPFTREMKQFIAINGLQDCVTELTHASNQDLHTLYCAAELLFFPSLQEGFGWPIIEALACGCPVVTANRPPMTEIGGEAATYTGVPDPADSGRVADSMAMADKAARTIASMLSESSAQRRLRVEKGMQHAARFSSAAMVDGYVEIYREMLNPGIADSRWPLETEFVR